MIDSPATEHSRSGQYWPWLLVSIGALCLSAPFLYAYCFCYPRGDDFDFAVKAAFPLDLPGGIYEAGREWIAWSGRYSAHFLAVFLGRATENRFFYGLVCLTTVFVFWTGARLLLRERLERSPSIAGAFLAILGLYAFYQNLPDFYLYTDCLSVIVQEAVFLIFLAFLINFFKRVREEENARYGKTLAAGLIAIGVYEHAAFAVAWTLISSMVFFDWKRTNENGANLIRKLVFFLFCGICASLFAPGNFARKSAREADWAKQLIEAPADWINSLIDYVSGYGFLGFLFLGCFLALFQKRGSLPFRAAAAALCAFAGLSLTLVFSQAMSDAPFASTPKFNASMGFYAALCETILIFALVSRMNKPMFRPLAPLWKKGVAFLFLCLFFVCVVLSENFKSTTRNALNGDMALLAEFMLEREKWISSFSNPFLWPERGLIGEIKNPRARESRVDLTRTPIEVCPILYPVFPVYTRETLSENPAVWPNLYAAWASGVASIKAGRIDKAGIIAKVKSGDGLELRVPDELNWIREARIIPINGENATFSVVALRLEFIGARPREIEILRPAPIFRSRPLPLFIQESLLNWLLTKKIVRYSPLIGATATRVSAEAPRAFAVIPLRADDGLAWPDAVFIKGEGDKFYRLSPWIN